MKKLKNNDFFWYSLGVVFNCLNSLVFMIIVTRINGLNDAGIFTYSYSLCCLFYFLEMYFNRPYQLSKDNKESIFNDLFSTRVVSSLIGLVIIFVFSLISKFSLFKIIVILLLYLLRDIEAFSDTIHGVFHAKDKLYMAGKALLIRAIISDISLLVIDLITHDLIISLIGVILLNLLVVYLYDYRNFKKISNFKIKISFKENTKFILKESFALFIYSFLNNMLINIQRYVLTYYVTSDVESIFGIIIMPATVMSLVSICIMNPFLNKFNKYKKEHNYKSMTQLLINIIIFLIVVLVVGLVGCYFLGIPVLEFVYGVELDEYKISLLLIIVASVFSAIVAVYSTILTLLGKYTAQLIIHIVCVIVSLILSWILIVNSGLHGAVTSYLISLFLYFVIYTIVYFMVMRRLSSDKS